MADNTQQFDPSIVALMHGLKMQEGAISGTSTNYNLKGKSGEMGAYQWLPATWQSDAKQYLGDPNAQMTPDNQNKVAYNKIKALKDAGKSPADIASLWNTGGDVARANQVGSGTNTSGAQYDAPAYVNNVIKYAKDYAAKNKKPSSFQGVMAPKKETPLAPRTSFQGMMSPSSIGGESTPSTGSNTQFAPGTFAPKNVISDVVGAASDTVKAVAGSEAAAGQDIAGATPDWLAKALGGTSATQLVDAYSKLTQSDQDTFSKIIQLRKQEKAEGKSTTQIDKMIKGYQFMDGKSVADVFPALNKSNEEVLGDALGVTLDLITAGAGGGEGSSFALTSAKDAKEAALADKGASLTKRIVTGASKGAALGAGFGLSGGMQQNEAPKDLALSAVVGGVGGAAVGGATDALLGKKPVDEQLFKDTEPPLKPKAQIDVYKRAGQEGGATIEGGTGKRIPTAKDKEIVDSVRNIPGFKPGDTAIAQNSAINKEVTRVSNEEIIPTLQKADKEGTPLNFQDVRDYVKNNSKPPAGYNGTIKQWQKVQETGLEAAANYLRKNGMDRTTLWEARKIADQTITKEFGSAAFSLEQKGNAKLASISFRNALQGYLVDSIGTKDMATSNKIDEFLNTARQKGINIDDRAAVKKELQAFYGVSNISDAEINQAQFAAQMEDVSNKLEARDRIAARGAKSKEIGSTRTSRFIKNNPIKAKILKKAATVGAGAGLGAVIGNKAGNQTAGEIVGAALGGSV